MNRVKVSSKNKNSLVPGWRIFYWYFVLNHCIRTLCNLKGKILDLGCNEGTVTRTLALELPFLEFYGVDISPSLIENAKRFSSNISYRVSSGERLPYKNNYFSAIVCFDVLEHVKNPQEIIKEIYRVLKPGGIFYFTTSLEGDSSTLYYLFHRKFGLNWNEKLMGHIQYFSYKQLRLLLEKSEFKIDKVCFYAHYLSQIYTIATQVLLGRFSQSRFIWIISFPFKLLFGIESIFFSGLRGLHMRGIARK